MNTILALVLAFPNGYNTELQISGLCQQIIELQEMNQFLKKENKRLQTRLATDMPVIINMPAPPRPETVYVEVPAQNQYADDLAIATSELAAVRQELKQTRKEYEDLEQTATVGMHAIGYQLREIQRKQNAPRPYHYKP